jgi:dTDP-4-amino-4,6-dideoxy-D-glucose/dTDP-4-amino-2,4-dideoxy-beta-L-xylose transaminase
MKTIPVFRVLMSPDARERVGDVLESGYIGQGEQVERFERRLGEVIGTREPPLALNSCTSAIDLALHLCGVGPGAEVITTPITCTATNSHIPHRGARIVWADVDPRTGNIDPSSVAQLVTWRTKAVIAVDWAGRVCDYAALRTAAAGLPIIEDAAHAFLSTPLGGDYQCWSFQAIKSLTCGDGGALLAPPDQMERGRLLRWYGLDRRSSADFRCAQDIGEIGFKTHMNDIAASIGLANLDLAGRGVQACRENAAYYTAWLSDLPGIRVPAHDPGCSYWLYTILVDDRADFSAYLAARGIASTQTHRRNDVHTAFRAASETPYPLPGVQHFDDHQVSIPVGWWVSPQQREYIARTVAEWALGRAGRNVA